VAGRVSVRRSRVWVSPATLKVNTAGPPAGIATAKYWSPEFGKSTWLSWSCALLDPDAMVRPVVSVVVEAESPTCHVVLVSTTTSWAPDAALTVWVLSDTSSVNATPSTWTSIPAPARRPSVNGDSGTELESRPASWPGERIAD
jgi:hypothetical protein